MSISAIFLLFFCFFLRMPAKLSQNLKSGHKRTLAYVGLLLKLNLFGTATRGLQKQNTRISANSPIFREIFSL